MILMQDIIQEISTIKPFSKMAQKILTALQKEETALKEISELIQFDPAMFALIMKTVNSAAYTHSSPIKDISTAVSFLGRSNVKQLVLVAASEQYFSSILEGYESFEGEIWRQAISTTIVASKISKSWDNIDITTLFSASLLHDIGKIILSQYVEEEWKTIQDEIKVGLNFIKAEKKVLGFNHCDIGAALLKQWNFEPSVINAAKYHHSPLQSEDPIVHIVTIAEYIVMLMGYVSQFDGLHYSGYAELLEKYNIQTEELERIISDSAEQIETILSVLKG